MMAYNSSTSSLSFSSSTSSSISESSAYSSPCSSPPSLPLPPSPYVNKLSVPFLWEEKPGITKPTPSSSSLKSSTLPKNLFYGHSLQLPPLPPPPCLSQASLSQPRSKEIKLLSFHSLISRRSNEAKPSKEEQQEDPFFLALKACTKVDNREEKSSFDGLPSALSIFKPTKKSVECKSGYSYEDSNHHQTRREVSFNPHHHHHQTRRELCLNGEGNKRCTSVATSTHGALHDFFSMGERTSRVERRGSNLYTLMLEKDEESTNSIAKRAHHHHMNAAGKASSSGCFMSGGMANRDKEDDPIQDLHAKASRREHLMVGGQSKLKVNGREVIDAEDGHRKPKHKAYNCRQSNDTLDRMKQGHTRAKHNAHVVEFNYCGGYIKNHDIDVHKHHANKLNMLSDMLGCKPLPPLHGAAIHPSLHFQDKLFSHPR